MKFSNLLKKNKSPHTSAIKDRVKTPEGKRDWFDTGLIIATGLLIGSLAAYLIITNTPA